MEFEDLFHVHDSTARETSGMEISYTEFEQGVSAALTTLASITSGLALLQRLRSGLNNVVIDIAPLVRPGINMHALIETPPRCLIIFNPNVNNLSAYPPIYFPAGSPNNRAVGLGHELIHVLHRLEQAERTIRLVKQGNIREEEHRTVGIAPYANITGEITENHLRSDLGMPPRNYYDEKDIPKPRPLP